MTNHGVSGINSSPQAQHRFHELDGVRGLAAVFVGFWHSMVIWIDIGHSFLAKVLLSVFNGPAAVNTFFILSGIVLAGLIKGIGVAPIIQFYFRRLTRLYIPVFFSVTIFSLFLLLINHAQVNSGNGIWINYFDNNAVTLKNYLGNMFAYRYNYNPVLWTIRVEIFFSVLFPIFYILWKHGRFVTDLFILFVLVLAAIVFRHEQQDGAWVIHYLYMFYTGMVMRRFLNGQKKYGRRKKFFMASMVSLFVLFFVTSWFSSVCRSGAHPISFDLLSTVLIAVFLFTVLIEENSSIARVLTSRPIQFVGMISYSYYLINYLFILIFGIIFMRYNIQEEVGHLPSTIILAISSFLATIPISYLFFLAIEKPSVAFSRRLGAINITMQAATTAKKP